jgi:hypothetical protein
MINILLENNRRSFFCKNMQNCSGDEVSQTSQHWKKTKVTLVWFKIYAFMCMFPKGWKLISFKLSLKMWEHSELSSEVTFRRHSMRSGLATCFISHQVNTMTRKPGGILSPPNVFLWYPWGICPRTHTDTNMKQYPSSLHKMA